MMHFMIRLMMQIDAAAGVSRRLSEFIQAALCTKFGSLARPLAASGRMSPTRSVFSLFSRLRFLAHAHTHVGMVRKSRLPTRKTPDEAAVAPSVELMPDASESSVEISPQDETPLETAERMHYVRRALRPFYLRRARRRQLVRGRRRQRAMKSDRRSVSVPGSVAGVHDAESHE